MKNTNNIMEWIQENNLRKKLLMVIFVFIALFMVAKTVLVYKQAVNYKDVSSLNYLSVNGKAEKYVQPDTLTFNITVNEEGKTNSEATKKVADKIAKANSILKANGVKESDIKLGYYNVQDKYDTPTPCGVYTTVAPGTVRILSAQVSAPCVNSGPQIIGQIITHTLEVKIPNIAENADNDIRTKIISQLSAENIKADGFTFTVYDIDAVKKEIRAEAIANAKADAKKLARDLGVRLDDLTSFSENDLYNPYMSARTDTMVAKGSEAGSVPSAPELNPGQQKVTSTVTLTYTIR